VGGFFPGMNSGKGVGALDAFAAASLRDAIFSAASEAHADAAAVLAEAPPTTIFLRPSPGGDGGDLETHVAVALFWGMRRREREARASSEPSAAPSEAPEAPEAPAPASRATVVVTSRLGLKRALTATELALIIAERVATDDRARRLLVDARVAPGDSGVVRLTTAAHHDARRRDGFLRCKLCGRFVAGERALWWHSKTKHGIKHAEAADDATNESRALFALRARATTESYRDDAYSRAKKNATREDSDPGPNESPNRRIGPVVSVRAPSDLAAGLAAARRGDETALAALVASGKVEALADPGLDAARRGDARALRALVLEGKWDPRVARDRHGAGALLWSAGAGHLACVRLLCEEAPVGREPLDPNDPATHQGGRRAYRGRTALHWAARNGHLDVVRYLVTEKNADVDARTFEGTTAFGWAVWRGRLEVARWLVEQGKCAFAAVNTFGCNAAMWCAQGAEEERDEREAKSAGEKLAGADPPANSDELGEVPPTTAYVASLGVSFRPINANGHSAVHKAAQRGRRDVCAFLLGRRWPRGLDAPRGGDANEKNEKEKEEEARARALVDANHLRRDDEGFRPSDLARLAGDAKLHAWLAAEEKAHDEEEADAETRPSTSGDASGRDASGRDASGDARLALSRARDATVSYALYPPTTFYGAASLGDVSLLSRVLREDVYGVNDDIAGVGSVLHVAVARGHAALVAAALRGDFGERADVNRKSSGAFGLTPLHLAATLFTRREAHARAERALASAEAELERLRARDPRAADGLNAADGVKLFKGEKQARREEKSDAKKARRDAHGKAAEARKILAVDAAGARDAVRIYRLLLQAGADTRAVAKVPAKFVFAGTEAAATKEKAASTGTARLVSALPRDLAGGAAAAELAALELEVAEAPPALFHASRHPRSLSSQIQANGAEVPDDGGRRRTPRPRDPTTTGFHKEPDDPTRLFRAGVAEAEARRVTRAEVPGVPGAFVLDHVLGVEACASLCAFVDSLVDGAMTDKGAETRKKNAPRRESAASRAERLALASCGNGNGNHSEKEKGLEGLETLFARVARDPLSLVAATTTPDGTTHHPVEPTNWDVPAEALRELAARCRPFLPSAGKETTAKGEKARLESSPAFAASLAPAGFELATRLRCYRYDPGTASPPHFDKAGPGPVVDGRETRSGYSVVLYLNGDDLVADASLGGETTFFRPLGDRDVAKSRRGFTIAVGDGAAPLTRVSARVRARTGAALFFPHGTVSGCFESPLHEGSAMRGDAAKYVLRTDVCYFARSGAR
jgi:ankyrin repeat protein